MIDLSENAKRLFNKKAISDFISTLVCGKNSKRKYENFVDSALDALMKSAKRDRIIAGKEDRIYRPILSEHKVDAKLIYKKRTAAKSVAQTVSYLYEKFREDNDIESMYIKYGQVIDQMHAIFFTVEQLSVFFDETKYKFTKKHCDPPENLIKDILVWKDFINAEVYTLRDGYIHKWLNKLADIFNDHTGPTTMTFIQHKNFPKIFSEWKKQLAINLDNAQLEACLFLSDINKTAKLMVEPKEALVFCDDNHIEHVIDIDAKAYKNFWSYFYRPVHPDEYNKIVSYKDRIIHINLRWKDGEFFTPYDIVDKAYEEFLSYYNMDYQQLKNYTVWDPCAGQGNLLRGYPGPAYENCFLSTLNKEDIELMTREKRYLGALKFQYDFLNQLDEELPIELLTAFRDTDRKWLFLMNPPWGSNCGGGKDNKRVSDENKKIIQTKIKKEMVECGLGRFSSDLMYQCIFRMVKLINKFHLNSRIILFCNWNVLFGTSPVFRKFLNELSISLRTGFLFNGNKYFQTKGIPLACCLIFDKHTTENEIDQIKLKLYDKSEIGHMIYQKSEPIRLLSKIEQNKKTSSIFQLNNSDLSIKGKISGSKHDIMGYVETSTDCGNCYLHSTQSSYENGWFLNSSNIDYICLYALRKFVMQKWYYNNCTTYRIFDCSDQFKDTLNTLVFLAFHPTYGRTTSFVQKFEDQIISIRNPFSYISKQQFESFPGITQDLLSDCISSQDSWFTTYLKNHESELHPAAKEVIRIAIEITKKTLSLRTQCSIIRFKKKDGTIFAIKSHLDTRWDVGWYQIVNGIIYKNGNMNTELSDEIKDLYKQFQLKMVELEDYLKEVVKGLKLADEVVIYE